MDPVDLKTVHVLLLDDHQLLSHAIAIALRAEGMRVTLGTLSDRGQLLRSAIADPPDLVLLDLDLGGALGDGVTLVCPLRECGSRVIIVTGTRDRAWLGAAVEAGAEGIVDKATPFSELLATVVAAAHGDSVIEAAERRALIGELHRVRDERRHLQAPFDQLTHKEQQVLRALGSGRTVRRIARDWYVSEATVRSQVRGVLMKLGVSSQLEAVTQALRAGWLTAHE